MMSLHSPLYLVFLVINVLFYWTVVRFGGNSLRLGYLLFVSYLFYGLMDLRYPIVLAAVTLANYAMAHWIDRRQDSPWPLRAGILFNLAVLAGFKYMNFFLGYGSPSGTAPGPFSWTAWAPIGISFYIFQAIAILVEIRQKRQSVPTLLKFSLYLAFFPRLIAGPILLPRSFFPQVDQLAERPSKNQVLESLSLLIMGLFKKVVIADSLGSISAVAFHSAGLPGVFPSPLYIQGFYLYALQIYSDFSGYTDLARGSALLLGFKMPPNFNRPYLAVSVGDFWNRWHMSLTQWFREYLFFPLSRRLLGWSKQRYSRFSHITQVVQAAANLITMLVIGLWHGAGWTFLLWGAYHGILLTLERLWAGMPQHRVGKILHGLLTFHLVGIGWIIFESSTIESAWKYWVGLLSFRQMQNWALILPAVTLGAFLTFGLDWLEASTPRFKDNWAYMNLRRTVIIASILSIIILQTLAAARGGLTSQFIYGRF